MYEGLNRNYITPLSITDWHLLLIIVMKINEKSNFFFIGRHK